MTKKDLKLQSIHDLPFILILVGVVIMLLAFYVFGAGYHNVDMGHNMKWFECEYNTSLIDYTSHGTYIDAISAYNLGWQYVRIAFFMLLIGTSIFFSGLVDLMNQI